MATGRARARPSRTSPRHLTAAPPPLNDQDAAYRMVTRFGRPSAFGLSGAELGRHIAALRRQGWQKWECLARFGRVA